LSLSPPDSFCPRLSVKERAFFELSREMAVRVPKHAVSSNAAQQHAPAVMDDPMVRDTAWLRLFFFESSV
jgi:hypothetical protein